MYPKPMNALQYSSYKEPFDAVQIFLFTNKNIESRLISTSLLQLWPKAGGTSGRSNYIERLVVDAGKKSYINSKKRTARGPDSS